MMFKEIFHFDSVAVLTQLALVIFVIVFFATALWTYTRPRRDVSHWSALPLEDGSQPITAPIAATTRKERRS